MCVCRGEVCVWRGEVCVCGGGIRNATKTKGSVGHLTILHPTSVSDQNIHFYSIASECSPHMIR